MHKQIKDFYFFSIYNYHSLGLYHLILSNEYWLTSLTDLFLDHAQQTNSNVTSIFPNISNWNGSLVAYHALLAYPSEFLNLISLLLQF